MFILTDYLYGWGFFFFLITTLIGIFKKEEDNMHHNDNIKINIFQRYKLMWTILKIPGMSVLLIATVTSSVISNFMTQCHF